MRYLPWIVLILMAPVGIVSIRTARIRAQAEGRIDHRRLLTRQIVYGTGMLGLVWVMMVVHRWFGVGRPWTWDIVVAVAVVMDLTDLSVYGTLPPEHTAPSQAPPTA
jgi:cell division protein FtsW (lipid II flippase)